MEINFTTTKPLNCGVIDQVRTFSYYFSQEFMELLPGKSTTATEVHC